MGWMIADAKGAPSDFYHILDGPDLAAIAIRAHPALQQTGQLSHLLGSKLRCGTRSRVVPKRLDAPLVCLPEPLAQRAGGGTVGSRDVSLLPALLFQCPCPASLDHGSADPFQSAEPEQAA
jgi:hypothetical protein